ncbi:MAG: gamma-glutamyltransferase family protein [Planctomycetota bacterium]|nr:gamma-glutamyltransferase family protein [Planctomycetota bacterium]
MPTRTARPGFWPGRSNVLARRGAVTTSQPLAAQAGLDMLRKGGNAIDAALATAAALCVVEPMSTGLGGDVFALYWSAKDAKLKGLNGSGRCPKKLSWRDFARVGLKYIPQRGWKAVTVPGTVDGWWTLHQADGKLPWKALFEPAIHYAREGFPLSEIIAGHFAKVDVLLQNDAARAIFLPGGASPAYGQVFKQSDLARTFEFIAAGGRDAYYEGETAAEFVRAAEAEGGYFSAEDLAAHRSTWVEPVSAHFQGLDVFELPPNGQGIAALIALNVLASQGLAELKKNWGDLAHATLEAVKLAYAEREAHVADPEFYAAPLRKLLSLTFATHAGMTIEKRRAVPRSGSLAGAPDGDTVLLCAADGDGNLVTLINSLFMGFGSGVVAGRSGVMLQNRGACFTLKEGHPNRIEPGKRPFHTIIPGFAMRHGKPHLAFGVMGGHHQAQGHVQVLVNLALHELSLQEALAAPRFDFRTENFVALERDYPEELRQDLAQRGHSIVPNDFGPFGGAQAIRRLGEDVWEAASDPRKDGCAVGW